MLGIIAGTTGCLTGESNKDASGKNNTDKDNSGTIKNSKSLDNPPVSTTESTNNPDYLNTTNSSHVQNITQDISITDWWVQEDIFIQTSDRFHVEAFAGKGLFFHIEVDDSNRPDRSMFEISIEDSYSTLLSNMQQGFYYPKLPYEAYSSNKKSGWIGFDIEERPSDEDNLVFNINRAGESIHYQLPSDINEALQKTPNFLLENFEVRNTEVGDTFTAFVKIRNTGDDGQFRGVINTSGEIYRTYPFEMSVSSGSATNIQVINEAFNVSGEIQLSLQGSTDIEEEKILHIRSTG